jgi:anti-sigma B factor antagonist
LEDTVVNNPGDMDMIALEGRLDESTAADLQRALCTLLETGYTRLIINCDKLDCINDTGIDVVLHALKKAQDLGGDIRLVCTDPDMKKALDEDGLSKILSVFVCDDDAIKSYLFDHPSSEDLST